MGNRDLIALRRTAFRFLATPTQLLQDLPDVTGMIRDLKMLLDQFCDPLQRPQVGLIASGEGAFDEQVLQFLFLFRRELRGSSRNWLGSKSSDALAFVGCNPTLHRTARST